MQMCIEAFIIVSEDLLYVCGIGYNVTFVISDCSYLDLLSLFLYYSSYHSSDFVYPFKKPALGFVDSLYGFLGLNFIQFHSDFNYFFSSASFGISLFLFF